MRLHFEWTRVDRGPAVAAMTRDATAVVERLHAEGRLDAILGIEGSGGSSIVSTAMRALPNGIGVGHSSMYGAVFRMLYKRA
jgi:uncharacterized protein (UPF0261 family)